MSSKLSLPSPEIWSPSDEFYITNSDFLDVCYVDFEPLDTTPFPTGIRLPLTLELGLGAPNVGFVVGSILD